MLIHTIKHDGLYLSNMGNFLIRNKVLTQTKIFDYVLTEHYKSAFLSANARHLFFIRNKILERKELPDTNGNMIKLDSELLIIWPLGEIFLESELIDELNSRNFKYL